MTNNDLVGFEHIGMTVADLDRTVAFYCDLLGLELVLRKPQATGELGFFDAGGGMLEVIAPSDGAARAEDVPNGRSGMRHLTLSYTSINAVLDRLRDAGVEIIEEAREAYNQEMLQRVAFVRDPDGIIVELAERTPGRPTRQA
ncbi:VOC family protein [Devosia pacifica]|nr:VOC family protein [Devosia pacifica]